MLGSVRDSHRLRVRKVIFTLTWQRVCLSIQRNSLRGVSSEWSGSTVENSPQQRQLQLRSSGWTPRRATRSICLVFWVDQAAAPVEVRREVPAVDRPEVPAAVRPVDSPLACASREPRAAVAPVDHRAAPVEVPQGDLQAVSLIEHRLDTGPRTEHPLRQFRALFQFLHRSRHQPLRQAHLIRFQSGLALQALFR